MKTPTIPTLLGPDGMTSLREYAGYHGGGSGFGGQLRAWNPPGESVDAALLPNFTRGNARADDLVRINGYAANAIQLHQDHIVGSFFRLSHRPSWRYLGIGEEDARAFSREVEAAWKEFAEDDCCCIDAYIPPHTGLPANSTDIAPPDIPAGFVAVFNSDESSWHLVEDHRGKTVYDVASGDALFISELGSLPENVTWLSPEGEFQKWNGTAWVKDTEAEKLFRIREVEETKNSLMQVASEHIAPLQDAVDLEIATEEETLLLEAWKKYRVLLNRVDTSTAQDIEWPVAPIG